MLIFYSALRVVSPVAVRGGGDRRSRAAAGHHGDQAAGDPRRAGRRDDLLDHRQLPAVQRAEHPAEPGPQRDHHLFHAQPVRLLPVVLRPAVQLLCHRRHRHGHHHDGHRLCRPAARPAEGELTMAARTRTRAPCCAHPDVGAALLLLPRSCCLHPAAAGLAGHQRHQDAGGAVRLVRPVVRRRLRPVGQHRRDLHLRRRHLPRWLLNTLLYVVVGAGGATLLAVLGGYGLAKFDFPGKRARVRTVIGAVAVPGHGAGGADLPDVQQDGADQHPWAVIIPSLVSPVRPLPDVDVRRATRSRPRCSRRRGWTARASCAPSSRSACRCWPPASSRCCCSPWSPPGTTTSCR